MGRQAGAIRPKRLPGPTIYGQKFGKLCPRKSRKKAKEKWATLKPKLDAARTKRGIHEIDPQDKEYV